MNRADKELELILNDKVHGSSELLNLLYKHFLKYKEDTAYLRKALIRINKYLAHFPVIINFTKDIETILKEKKEISLLNYLNSFKKNEEIVCNTIFESAKNKLLKCKTVLTISHSKTLIKIFQIWKKFSPGFKIIICESRPENEGILMAEEISKFGIETEIITEAMTGKEIQKIDAVVLGADQILINGNVINKSGSRMLAVLAHHQDIPVYVLAASQKKVKRKIIKQDSLANKEISKQDNKLIKFRYEYFEEIEKELITKIFND